MFVITQKFIFRTDLENNPDVLYVFGDNTERVGYGGQAKEMRDEPNAFGVATKRMAAHNNSCYFSDSKECFEIVSQDLRDLDDMLGTGKWKGLVIPADGLGTGLAELQTRAPKLLAYIEGFLEGLAEKYDV